MQQSNRRRTEVYTRLRARLKDPRGCHLQACIAQPISMSVFLRLNWQQSRSPAFHPCRDKLLKGYRVGRLSAVALNSHSQSAWEAVSSQPCAKQTWAVLKFSQVRRDWSCHRRALPHMRTSSRSPDRRQTLQHSSHLPNQLRKSARSCKVHR